MSFCRCSVSCQVPSDLSLSLCSVYCPSFSPPLPQLSAAHISLYVCHKCNVYISQTRNCSQSYLILPCLITNAGWFSLGNFTCNFPSFIQSLSPSILFVSANQLMCLKHIIPHLASWFIYYLQNTMKKFNVLFSDLLDPPQHTFVNIFPITPHNSTFSQSHWLT